MVYGYRIYRKIYYFCSGFSTLSEARTDLENSKRIFSGEYNYWGIFKRDGDKIKTLDFYFKLDDGPEEDDN